MFQLISKRFGRARFFFAPLLLLGIFLAGWMLPKYFNGTWIRTAGQIPSSGLVGYHYLQKINSNLEAKLLQKIRSKLFARRGAKKQVTWPLVTQNEWEWLGWPKQSPAGEVTYAFIFDLDPARKTPPRQEILRDEPIPSDQRLSPRLLVWVKNGNHLVSEINLPGQAPITLDFPLLETDGQLVSYWIDAHHNRYAIYLNGKERYQANLGSAPVTWPAPAHLRLSTHGPKGGVQVKEIGVWNRKLNPDELGRLRYFYTKARYDEALFRTYFWVALGLGLIFVLVRFYPGKGDLSSDQGPWGLSWAHFKKGPWSLAKKAFFTSQLFILSRWTLPLSLLSVALYLPALLLDFGIHNDYLFEQGKDDLLMGYPEATFLAKRGRILNAILLSTQFSFVTKVSDLAIARAIAVATSLLVAWLISWFLFRKVKLSAPVSAAMGFLIILLPSVQLYVLWVTNYANLVSLLFSILAYLLWDSGVGQKKGRWPKYGLGFFFLLVSFFTYPPNSFFFLVLAIAKFLFEQAALRKTKVVRLTLDVIFQVAGIGSYYLLQKFIIPPILVALSWAGEDVFGKTGAVMYAFDPQFSLGAKLNIIQQVSEVAWGLHWAVLPTENDWSVHLTLLIFLGLFGLLAIINFGRQDLAKKLPAFLLSLVGVVGTILLVNAPYIMREEAPLSYRISLPYTAILVLVLLWGFFSLEKILVRQPAKYAARFGITAFMLSVFVIAGINITRVSVEKHFEYGSLKASMGEANINQIQLVHAILAPNWSGFTGKMSRDFALGCFQTHNISCLELLKRVYQEAGGWKNIVYHVISPTPDHYIKHQPHYINELGADHFYDANHYRIDKEYDYGVTLKEIQTQAYLREWYKVWGYNEPEDPVSWQVAREAKAADIIGVRWMVDTEKRSVIAFDSHSAPYQIKPFSVIFRSQNNEVATIKWRLVGSYDQVSWTELGSGALLPLKRDQPTNIPFWPPGDYPHYRFFATFLEPVPTDGKVILGTIHDYKPFSF